MQGLLQILRLVDALGRVEGRKKLQKIVHILQAKGHDFPQKFGYLHYGPFSSEVAAEVDALVSGELVHQEGSGQPYEAYVYTPGESAKKLLNELQQTEAPDWMNLARDLNQKNVSELEAISTILYLQANGFVGEKLRIRFAELKPALRSLYEAAHAAASRLPKAP